MQSETKCMGNMFPDIIDLAVDRSSRGEVFEVILHNSGLGRPRAEVHVDQHRWEACFGCESYRKCYDLSMARLSLCRAVKSFV